MTFSTITRLVCAGMTLWFSPTCIAADETEPKVVAEKVVDLLVDKQFDEVASRFDGNLKAKLPASQLEAVWKQLQGAVGEYHQTESPVEIAKGTFESTVSFSKLALIVRVSVAAGGDVNGLFMRPAPLKNPPPAAKADGAQALKFRIGDAEIHGTLLVPDQAGDKPLVLAVLHAGSGPTDRDGNQPLLRNDSLRKLAEELAIHGIATFRYDKRGSGETGMVGDESQLKLQTYANDLSEVVQGLRARSDFRFRTVALVGHSEGAQVCMLAAKLAKVDRVVAVAGSGRDLKELLQSQLKGKLTADLEKRSDEILAALSSGRLVKDDIPDALMSLYRPSVQPFLISCIQTKPTDLAAALKVPLLIVQGDQDIQVKVEDAERLLKAQPNAELAIFKGMNHVLRIIETEADQMESYQDPTRELAPGLSKKIANFLSNVR